MHALGTELNGIKDKTNWVELKLDDWTRFPVSVSQLFDRRGAMIAFCFDATRKIHWMELVFIE